MVGRRRHAARRGAILNHRHLQEVPYLLGFVDEPPRQLGRSRVSGKPRPLPQPSEGPARPRGRQGAPRAEHVIVVHVRGKARGAS